MARVPLSPIGSPRESFLDDASFARNRRDADGRNQTLQERRAAVAQGWGEKYAERVHQKGKLTARERI
ncbi:MAG: propionyl-CoA carboxylase, partial [Planctomycetota bacterium]